MKKKSFYLAGIISLCFAFFYACTSEDDNNALFESLTESATKKNAQTTNDTLQNKSISAPDSLNPYALSDKTKADLLAYAKSKNITIELDDNPSQPINIETIKQFIDGLGGPFRIVAIDSIPVTKKIPRLRSSAENEPIHFTGSPSSGTKSIRAEKVITYTTKEYINGKWNNVKKEIEFLAIANVTWNKYTEESEGTSRIDFDAYCINGTKGYNVFCNPGTSSESFITNGKENSEYQVLSVSVYGECSIEFTATMPGIKSVSATIAVSLSIEGSQGTASISII